MAADKGIFHHYYYRWLQRRNPAHSLQQLHRKNIFILPSRTGLGFLLTVILLWLLGTNYQNNLVLILAFLLLSLMHTTILYTYTNLSGLSLESQGAPASFVGESVHVDFLVKNTSRRNYRAVTIGWPGDSEITVDVEPESTKTISLRLPLKRRGWFKPERLTVSTVYPLGFIRAWSRLDMAIKVLAYPKPMAGSLSDKTYIIREQAEEYADLNEHQDHTHHDVADDISHLREYQQGDSPRRIAWKTYAKGQGLATKEYESISTVEQQQWIAWDDFPGLDVESRLSRLCDCVLQAEDLQLIYGLRLPNKVIELGEGLQHKQTVLRELALFRLP